MLETIRPKSNRNERQKQEETELTDILETRKQRVSLGRQKQEEE